MLAKLLSRKLILGAAAIGADVGIVLGLAVIQPSLLIDAKEIVGAALVGINGIAGFGVAKQAEVDRMATNGGP